MKIWWANSSQLRKLGGIDVPKNGWIARSPEKNDASMWDCGVIEILNRLGGDGWELCGATN